MPQDDRDRRRIQGGARAVRKGAAGLPAHADAYRDDQQHLATDYAAYNAASKDLQAQYKDIEQKRQDLLARRDSLHNTREETLNRFNEVRDRLVALQSKPK
jgi:chromosome segregation ATPase